MVDFLGDGLKISRTGLSRAILTICIFSPPFLLAAWDPAIFVTAISFAGGFGEAFLNGLLPVLLVWVGRYAHRLGGEHQLGGERYSLAALLLSSIFVMAIELVILFGK